MVHPNISVREKNIVLLKKGCLWRCRWGNPRFLYCQDGFYNGNVQANRSGSPMNANATEELFSEAPFAARMFHRGRLKCPGTGAEQDAWPASVGTYRAKMQGCIGHAYHR